MNKDRIWLFFMRLGQASGCHQRGDRSFFIGRYQCPVCARCAGSFFGEIAGIVLWICGVRLPIGCALVMMAVMGVDWGIQRVGLCESTNLRRLFTGMLCGCGMFQLLLRLLGSMAEKICR